MNKTFTLPMQIVKMPIEIIKYNYFLTILGFAGFIFMGLIWFITNRKNKQFKRIINEVIEMDELKRQTMKTIKEMEQDMVERIKTAQESGEGIDLMSRNAKLMEFLERLDNVFIEAKLRTVNKKKGGYFSR